MRSRDYEVLVGDRWEMDPRADLRRIKRQQEFIHRMIKKALASSATNPVHLTALARRFSNHPRQRRPLTLLTGPTDVAGTWAQKLLAAEARPILDRMNGKAPLASSDQSPPATARSRPGRPRPRSTRGVAPVPLPRGTVAPPPC